MSVNNFCGVKYASDEELYKGATYREEEILKSQLSELVLKSKHDPIQFFNTLTFAEQDHVKRHEKKKRKVAFECLLLFNCVRCKTSTRLRLRVDKVVTKHILYV